jgi:hypothetical protein
MIKILGLHRFLFAILLVVTGCFLAFALSQASHFGWGFGYMDAALRYALFVPVVLVVESVLVMVRLIRRSVQSEAEKSQTQETLTIYLLGMWGLWGLYFVLVT